MFFTKVNDKLEIEEIFEREIVGVDIAVNPTYVENIDDVCQRAFQSKILPVFIGMDSESNTKVIEFAEKYGTFCYVGFHPNHLVEDVNKSKIEELCLLLKNERVIGVGECGLDYCRSTNRDVQKEIFKKQLEIKTNKPYFLHLRDAFDDFMEIVEPYKEKLQNSIMHSFTGSVEEARKLVEFGFKIGINGCSMRENVDVVKFLNLEDILIETDSPFCLIRKSYAASDYCKPIKAKSNEPAFVTNVAEAIAAIKNVKIEEVLEKTKNNFRKIFLTK